MEAPEATDGSNVKSETKCSQRLPDLAWVRANAENLLFLEHLQRQAAEENLYGWRSQLSSQDYQARLDQIRTGQVVEQCTSDEDVNILERMSVLEERLGNCGGESFPYALRTEGFEMI